MAMFLSDVYRLVSWLLLMHGLLLFQSRVQASGLTTGNADSIPTPKSTETIVPAATVTSSCTLTRISINPPASIREQLRKRVDPQIDQLPGYADLRRCARNCVNGFENGIFEFSQCNSYKCVCRPDNFALAAVSLSSCINKDCTSDILDWQSASSLYYAFCHTTAVVVPTDEPVANAPAPPQDTPKTSTAASTLVTQSKLGTVPVVLVTLAIVSALTW